MSEEENKPMEIGEDWFCYEADFDCEEPHIILAHNDGGEKKKIPVPKQLAYYLSNCYCGSQTMHALIVNNAKKSVTDGIREILGTTV
jgi:hypothetical protein